MNWEVIIFAFSTLLGITGIGLGVFAIIKLNSISDTKDLYDAVANLENRPYVNPSQIKEINERLAKLDNVTTQQGQLLALVKKSAYTAEDMSKKLAIVYNQTASNKI